MASQNATFLGAVSPDAEFDHPEGLPVLRVLREGLRSGTWTLGEFENWRDSGWSVACRRGGSEVELVVASTGTPEEWMVQIAPCKIPGLLGRALGRAASASADQCQEVALLVHPILAGRFTRLRWRWDGFPDDWNSTAAPTPPRS
jgi:hypothetical protein